MDAYFAQLLDEAASAGPRTRKCRPTNSHAQADEPAIASRSSQVLEYQCHQSGGEEPQCAVIARLFQGLGDRPCGTRTQDQKETLQRLPERLKEDYPEARLVGHRDFPGVKKDCPCYDV